ncbi:porin [Catenovulum sediminis]|uniref:Porin n=1 Tax=Catenovulum sediminis TaxID=1740262 RepID=A0ABV1RL87_9ALTE|nr:porin [Catenovulum sediminis]
MSTVTKPLVSIALLSAAFTAHSSEPLTVYGKANISLQYADAQETSTDLKSNASRFGVKGELALDNGLSAIYQAEFGVDFADESKEKNVTARNQYVGLKGGFGQVRLGRMDTALKLAQGKVDLFNDFNGDIKHLFSGEVRTNDSVTYISPKFSDFTVGATYITHEESDKDQLDSAGLSAALMYGDSKFKKGSVYAALAFDNNVKGGDRVRLVAQTKLGSFKLGAILQRQKAEGAEDESGFVVNAAYALDAATFKIQYQTIDEMIAGDLSTISIGVDYKLGKSTKLYAWLADEDKALVDVQTLAVGMEHKF